MPELLRNMYFSKNLAIPDLPLHLPIYVLPFHKSMQKLFYFFHTLAIPSLDHEMEYLHIRLKMLNHTLKFPLSYYKVVVFIDPLQGLYAISIITILYLFYRYGYDI